MKKSLKRFVSAVASFSVLGSGLVLAMEGDIAVVSREDGSGTRSAFVELVGVEDDNGDDATTVEANVQNSTSAVLQTVAQNVQAIGYASLGSVDDTVKTLAVEGEQPSPEAIKEGKYPIVRPFSVAYKADDLSELAQDFLAFIASEEGQAIVEEEGLVTVTPADQPDAEDDAKEELEKYEAKGLEGEIKLAGSTSVTPVMEKLAEEYKKLNEGVTIDITSNGSTAGVTAAIDGMADLGMVSRELSDEEKEQLAHTIIAQDCIAVVAHPDNDVESISVEQVRQIFLGELTDWSEVSN